MFIYIYLVTLNYYFNSDQVTTDGFVGIKCERSCIYPNYGKECQFSYQCSKALCNVSIGCVQGTVYLDNFLL